MVTHHPVRDGLIAGLIGAASVAVWFLVLDSIAGRPLFTPAVLGAGVFALGNGAFGEQGFLANVLAYTIVHIAAFIVVGIVAAYAARAASQRSAAFVGSLVLFLVFEMAYFVGTSVLAGSPLFGVYAWWTFGIANLIAAVLMGRYLWRATHPLADWNWSQVHERKVHHAPM